MKSPEYLMPILTRYLVTLETINGSSLSEPGYLSACHGEPVQGNIGRSITYSMAFYHSHANANRITILLERDVLDWPRNISLYWYVGLGPVFILRKAEDARLKIGSQYILLYTVGLRFMPLDWVRILTFWCGTGTDKNHLLIFNWNRTVGVHMDAQRSRNHSLGKSGHLHINNEHSLTIKQKENCFQ